MRVIENNQVWFEAQNTVEKCAAISQAFGLGDEVNVFSFVFACLEDEAEEVHGPGINAPLACSALSSCPETHRTGMDSLGVPCTGDPDGEHFPKRSICPCEPLSSSPVPTLSEWGLIAKSGMLGIIGFMVIRRKLTV